MHIWMTEQLERVPGRSAIAQAFRHALTLWNGLTVFLEDGRAALDTNTVERAMRPVALGRKNALSAGSDRGGRHWAIVSTLVQTAKLNGLEPQAWLMLRTSPKPTPSGFSRIASDARAARENECRTRPPTSLWALKISFPTLPPILSHTLLHSSFLTGCTTGRIRAKSTVGCSVKSSQRRTISTAGHRRLYTHFGRRPLHTVSTCRRHSRSTGIRQHLVDPLVSRSQA
jgi:hypothetical protein